MTRKQQSATERQAEQMMRATGTRTVEQAEEAVERAIAEKAVARRLRRIETGDRSGSVKRKTSATASQAAGLIGPPK